MPALQSVQRSARSPENFPGVHWEQSTEPASEYCPEVQSRHSDRPEEEKARFPAGHSVQEVEAEGATEPDAHVLQLVARSLAWKVPVGHDVQSSRESK